jgi:DUF4097 and DUF4098 domain-containing protein YvlB
MKHQIFLLVLSVLFVAAVANAGLPSASNDDETQESTISKSFTVSKGGKLSVNVSGSDILISTWDKNEALVTVDGLDEEDKQYLKMSQSGNTVRVEYKPRGHRSSGGRFQINIPVEFNSELSTSGGDIELKGSIVGKVEGSTSGGDIKIEKGDGEIDLRTSGGDITVGPVKGNVELRTSGGDLDLGDVTGEANIKTSGGSIRVKSVGKKLDAATSGGNITIGDIGGEAKVATSGGDVRLGKVSGKADARTSGGDVEIAGASGNVVAKTSGGDLELNDISGSIQARTSGGSINADLNPTGKGNSSLKTSGGPIRIRIAENAKATIEAVINLNDSDHAKKYKIRSDIKPDSYETSDDEIRAVYTLNGGGETISLETSESNIEILKTGKK